jgi:hypothetical protein
MLVGVVEELYNLDPLVAVDLVLEEMVQPLEQEELEVII